MANDEAERAFLQSLQQDNTHIYTPTPQLGDPEKAFLLSMQQDDEYAPSQTSQTREADTALRSSRTVGGFIVDDEDEEDDSAHTPQEIKPSELSNVLLKSPKTTSPALQKSASVAPVTPLPKPAVPSTPPAQTHDSSTDVTKNIAQTPPSTKPPAFVTPEQKPVTDDSTSVPNTQPPNSRISILEERITNDPKGDAAAWCSLISEHRSHNNLGEARSVYERFFKIFPGAAEQWIDYANMELAHNEYKRTQQIFNDSLMTVQDVHLWSTYLNFVLRINNLSQDPNGKARQSVTETYDFVLQNVGNDKDSGFLWVDYIKFIRDGPGQIGGSSWQDQQKLDALRKAYQRAICVPTQSVNGIWTEYTAFESGLNKVAGRKLLHEQSPGFVTAKGANTVLQNMTRDLDRKSIPKLPPAPGFAGDVEYMAQISIWKNWIAWEKTDPLELKKDELPLYKARILYVYKQAVMALRFWDGIWAEASDFCFANGLEKEGDEFLTQATNANPECCHLCFKQADRLELNTVGEQNAEVVKSRSNAVREPYDKCLAALYNIIAHVELEGKTIIAGMEEDSTKDNPPSQQPLHGGDDDENVEPGRKSPASLQNAIETIQKGVASRVRLLSRTVTFVWIALTRAIRRIEGKGTPNSAIGGMRGLYKEARLRGRGCITSDYYIAVALIEHHCYSDNLAPGIFEKGMKLFPEDELMAVEYLKYLIQTNDVTNARSVFETFVRRMAQKPELLAKAKILYSTFHKYEACYGELSQLTKLEKRMSDLFPEDPQLAIFASRYAVADFDPGFIRPVISNTQLRPKHSAAMEKATSAQPASHMPLPPPGMQNSPKRQFEDSDYESNMPPRKIVRSDSPLKGAAGRRLDALKRAQARNGTKPAGSGLYPPAAPPPPPPPPGLPIVILNLLSMLPSASQYTGRAPDAEVVMGMIRNADLSRAVLRAPPLMPTQNFQPAGQQFQPVAQQFQQAAHSYGGQGHGRNSKSAHYKNNRQRKAGAHSDAR